MFWAFRVATIDGWCEGGSHQRATQSYRGPTRPVSAGRAPTREVFTIKQALLGSPKEVAIKSPARKSVDSFFAAFRWFGSSRVFLPYHGRTPFPRKRRETHTTNSCICTKAAGIPNLIIKAFFGGWANCSLHKPYSYSYENLYFGWFWYLKLLVQTHNQQFFREHLVKSWWIKTLLRFDWLEAPLVRCLMQIRLVNTRHYTQWWCKWWHHDVFFFVSIVVPNKIIPKDITTPRGRNVFLFLLKGPYIKGGP